jgi:alcohol dehydrogenase (NADP+)
VTIARLTRRTTVPTSECERTYDAIRHLTWNFRIDTYGAKYEDGTVSQGGFSSHIRVQEYFVFKIPENLDTAIAAPMLCAGLTTYSPLVRLGCGPGKKVGIVGIGGLGHFALMWAHALGAEVFAISHTKDKEEDAKKLGADHFIYSGDKDWAKPYAFKFDFILNCKSFISQCSSDITY